MSRLKSHWGLQFTCSTAGVALMPAQLTWHLQTATRGFCTLVHAHFITCVPNGDVTAEA